MRYLFLFVFLFLVNIQVQAKYTKSCVVKYETQQGWSKSYTVNVIFITGSELNTATKTYNYSDYSVYGVIFWGEGQATVIKISTYLGCGDIVDEQCINGSILNLTGTDQDGDEWEICTSDYCY